MVCWGCAGEVLRDFGDVLVIFWQTRAGSQCHFAGATYLFINCGTTLKVLTALKLETCSDNELRAAFNALDADSSGSLTVKEISTLFCSKSVALIDKRHNNETATWFITRFDRTGDGSLTFEEFRAGVG